MNEKILEKMQFILDHPYNETATNYIYDIYKEINKLVNEIERLNKIIKEIREYIEHTQNYGKEKIIYVNGTDILEILDKEKQNV